jgi:hypothetical protein
VNFIIAIYNKLDETSSFRSDIFDLFGTPDGMNFGLLGSKEGQKFKSLRWDWGLNGVKKTCKFLYWREHLTLNGFESWYRNFDFSDLSKMINTLLYVFKYKKDKIPAFVASVKNTEKKNKRLWFEFVPLKFVLLPPDFMRDYHRDFFTGGREDSNKWIKFFNDEYGKTNLDMAFQEIFSSATTQDQYHIIPVEYIDRWVGEHTESTISTKPLFVSSVIDNKKLLTKNLPTNNQIFWSIFSQYTGHTQVRGSFSIIVKGKTYSVTDIPVNAFVEKGYVYNHEVGVASALFQALQEALDIKAYSSFQENKFLKIEFSGSNSICLSESHFVKRAMKVGDTANIYDLKYKFTDYDYVLDLNPLGIKQKIAFDLTSGLWYKGFGKSKADLVDQWLHNLIDIPLNNPDIITVWHYGLTKFEYFDEGIEIGKWLIRQKSLDINQYLYLDKPMLLQNQIAIPKNLRAIFLPLYDDHSDFVSLKDELDNLAPKPGQDKIKNSGFYKVSSKLIRHVLTNKVQGQTH